MADEFGEKDVREIVKNFNKFSISPALPWKKNYVFK